MSKSGERRFDVTGLQVLASVLATVTGAVAASYLGVAGTIIGAAVMSLASTAGSAVYKHYLGRTAGRLKEAVPVVAAQRAADWMTAGTHAAAHQTHAGGTRPDQTRVDQTRADQTRVDQTQPVQTQPVQTRVDDAATGTAPQAQTQFPDGNGGGNGNGGGSGASRSGRWSAWLRRRPAWLAAVMASIGIFAGVIGGITVFEAAAGKPLQAVVWHHKGTGTTVGGLVGGQASHPIAPATHHAAPGHSASPAPTTSRTATGSASPSPTPSSASPSPTGSASPSPTATSPSPNPPAKKTAH